MNNQINTLQNYAANGFYQQVYPTWPTASTITYITCNCGAPDVSKYETALKLVQKLIEEGYIKDDLSVKDFLALVTKLVEDVL